MPSADDYLSSAPRETEVSACDVYFISVFTQKTHRNSRTHAYTADRWLMGAGVPPVPQWQWYNTSSCYKWVTVQHRLHGAPTCTHTHTHTHPFTPKSFIVWSFCVDVFPWLPPPPCCYHTKQHKGKDKIPPGHRDHNVTIQCLWRPCWCGNELLKEMWNYLTKALKEGA